MKKAILYIASIFIVLTAIGYVALKTFDLNAYKAEIIQAVKEKTGRDLTIAGEMQLKASFSPALLLTDVRLSNAPWASSLYMVQVGHLDVSVSLFPLLGKKVKIKHFVLNDVDVNLEVAKNGEKNWSFRNEKQQENLIPMPAEVQEETGDATPVSNNMAEQKKQKKSPLKGFEIESAEMKKAHLTYTDNSRGKDFSIQVETLRLKETDEGMRLALKTVAQEEEILVSGTVDPLSGIYNETKPFHLNLLVQGAETQLTLKAAVMNPVDPRDIQASLRIQGIDIARTAALAGLAFPDFKNFDLSVQMAGNPENLSLPLFDISIGRNDTVLIKASGSASGLSPLREGTAQVSIVAADMSQVGGLPTLSLPPLSFSAKATASGKTFRLDDVTLNAGVSDVKGTVFYQDEGKISAQAVFDSQLINLSDLFRKPVITASETATPPSATGYSQAAIPGKRMEPKKNTKSKKLFSTEPLNFDLLNQADVSLRFTIQKFIGADGTDLGQVAFESRLKDGVFMLNNFKVADFLQATANVDVRTPNKAEVKTDIKIISLPLSRLGNMKGRVDGVLQLAGSGRSTAEIASSLDGKVFLHIQDTVLDTSSINQLQPYLPKGALGSKGNIEMKCFVANFPIKDGFILSQQQIAMEAGPVQMQINGTADLSSEKLDGTIILAGENASVWNSVSGAFKLRGTLTKPDVVINTQKVVNNALSVGMAYLMGGARAAQTQAKVSLVQPCKTALEGGAPLKKEPVEKTQEQKVLDRQREREALEFERQVGAAFEKMFK